MRDLHFYMCRQRRGGPSPVLAQREPGTQAADRQRGPKSGALDGRAVSRRAIFQQEFAGFGSADTQQPKAQEAQRRSSREQQDLPRWLSTGAYSARPFTPDVLRKVNSVAPRPDDIRGMQARAPEATRVCVCTRSRPRPFPHSRPCPLDPARTTPTCSAVGVQRGRPAVGPGVDGCRTRQSTNRLARIGLGLSSACPAVAFSRQAKQEFLKAADMQSKDDKGGSSRRNFDPPRIKLARLAPTSVRRPPRTFCFDVAGLRQVARARWQQVGREGGVDRLGACGHADRRASVRACFCPQKAYSRRAFLGGCASGTRRADNPQAIGCEIFGGITLSPKRYHQIETLENQVQ